jgi:hypothetical protein
MRPFRWYEDTISVSRSGHSPEKLTTVRCIPVGLFQRSIAPDKEMWRVEVYIQSMALHVSSLFYDLGISTNTSLDLSVNITVSVILYLHHEMKFVPAIVAYACIVTALPSPSEGDEPEANGYYLVKTTAANCQPGQNYCYEQIVKDLGTLHSPSLQSLVTFMIPLLLNVNPCSTISVLS